MMMSSVETENFSGIQSAKFTFPLEQRVICILGAGASGKSTLLTVIEWVLFTVACIVNALMEQGISVLMRNMGDFLNMSWENRKELCGDIARYELVIFDDLGMERSSEFGLETVFRVINARYESGKPTIVTTNLSL
ncbi:MAG: ATP-binding protein [Lachnospiraceae bacterium]